MSDDVKYLGMTQTAIERLKRSIDGARHEDMQRPVVRRGRIVITWGPWSNGHEEQCAIVTNVYGKGEMVNLQIFVDEGAPVLANEVPFFNTKADAMAAMQTTEAGVAANSGLCAYYPDRE